MNCICQNAPQRPGMQDLLNSLERHSVCTGTQCFEGEADAFGVTTLTTTNAPNNSQMFFMFMTCALNAAIHPNTPNPPGAPLPQTLTHSLTHSLQHPTSSAPRLQIHDDDGIFH